jgi:hypothetical protein
MNPPDSHLTPTLTRWTGVEEIRFRLALNALIAITGLALTCGTGYADPSGGNGDGTARQEPAKAARHPEQGQTSGQGQAGKPVELAGSVFPGRAGNRTADLHTMTHTLAISQPGVIQPAGSLLKEQSNRGRSPAVIGGPEKIETVAAINGTGMKRKP